MKKQIALLLVLCIGILNAWEAKKDSGQAETNLGQIEGREKDSS